MTRYRPSPEDEVSMRGFACRGLMVLDVLSMGSACGAQGVNSQGSGGTTGQVSGAMSGGSSGMGGSSAVGGTTSSGGQPGTGGTPGSGSGGSTGIYVGTKTPGTAQTGDITVNPATTYQTMDGFGIADVWIGKHVHTAGLRKLFWDPVDGIGMTLLRIGIDNTGKIMGDAAFVDAPDVVKFGGKVWAAPWSPPASLKDNNDVNIATQEYGTNNKTYTRLTAPAGVKQHLWLTEIYYDEPKGSGKIDAGLARARGIYSGVSSGGVSGWHYWWTTHFMDGGSEANPPKRVYTMGNYSKFVRPGYVRVGISGVPFTVHMVSFVNPTDGTVAIVALNEGSIAQQVSFLVSGSAWPAIVIPHVTSANSNLAAGTAIPVTAGRLSASLEAQSVTTFVGMP